MDSTTDQTTPEGRAYLKKALSLLGTREPLEIMQASSSWLESLIRSRTPRELETAEAPGKWSVSTVVAHLAATELVYGYRVRVAVTVETPVFARFDQDAWSRRFGGVREDLHSSVGRFRLLRSWNLELLEAFTPEDLECTARHSNRGLETVGRMIKLWAAHDLVHIQQIDRILRAMTSSDDAEAPVP